MPKLNLEGKIRVIQAKNKRRLKPGRGSTMRKSMDIMGAWYLWKQVGVVWQWGALEDLGQVSNMMYLVGKPP